MSKETIRQPWHEAFGERYGHEPFTKDEAGLYEHSILRRGYFDGFRDARARVGRGEAVVPCWETILKPEWKHLGEILTARIEMAQAIAKAALSTQAKPVEVGELAKIIAKAWSGDIDMSFSDCVDASAQAIIERFNVTEK